MFEILTVCTGNICRSPLAEVLLRDALTGLPCSVSSAGTMDLGARAMTPEAQRLATERGVAPEVADAHRARALTPAIVQSANLILVMAREHRRKVLDLAPHKFQAVFAVREFARLAEQVSDAEVASAAAQAGEQTDQRLRAGIRTVTLKRGSAGATARPQDDDVIDPYRQPWETYELAATQLVPAVEQVIRVVKLALA